MKVIVKLMYIQLPCTVQMVSRELINKSFINTYATSAIDDSMRLNYQSYVFALIEEYYLQ